MKPVLRSWFVVPLLAVAPIVGCAIFAATTPTATLSPALEPCHGNERCDSWQRRRDARWRLV